VNRLGTLAIGIILLTVLLVVPQTATAQTSSTAAASTDAARIRELVAYARSTFADGQAQQQPPGGQKTLEERALARPVTALTVDEAVKRALDSNIELNVERLNPTVQELAWQQVRAAYTPTFGSTLNATASNPLPTSLLNGGTNVTNQTANYNINLTQALPFNGASFTAAFNNSRTNTTSTFATLNPQYTTQVTGTFNQPLLRNFKIDATRNSLQAAQITREITDVTLRRVVINTIAATRNAYWDLVAAIRAIAAAQQSLELAQKLVEDNQTRVEVGTLAPMDVISAQAEAATRRQTLTTAEATRRTAELVLKRLIVPNTDDPLWKTTLDPNDTPKIDQTPINLEAAVTAALKERTDLVTARKNLQSTDINITYLKNQMLPGLDATATYGTRGLGGNTYIREAGQVVGSVPGGWPDAFAMMSKFDYPNWTLGVVFSYPLGKSTQEVAYAKAKVQYDQTLAQLKGLELTVATEVTNAALSVESTLKRLEASRAARTLSEKRLENEQSKFEVGMSTNFFVVQAQRDLLDAQIAELRAGLDYQKALVEFERVQQASR
jgi:outer membrane protein TolC